MSQIQFYVCDYDIPLEPHSQRRKFYRRLSKILRTYQIEASTQSVWFLDNEKIAREIHQLASQFGHSNLYEATKLNG